MSNKSLEIVMIEELFKSVRNALAIPSKQDIETLNDKLDRIEKMLLKAAPAVKADVVEEAPVAVEEKVAAPVEEKVAAPVEKKVAAPVEKKVAAPVAKKKAAPAPSKKKKAAPAPAKTKKPVVAKKKKAAPGKKKEAASDRVLEVIQNQEQGADFKKIKAETKFDDKKIRNIIFRLHKLGQIEKVKRGIYKAS
jgi:outer membrane biosynthesis protein TonB